MGKSLCVIWLGGAVASMLLFFNTNAVMSQVAKGEENCETLPSEIHLMKGRGIRWASFGREFNGFSYISEEFDELGRLQRTCSGEVTINKCEGLCKSQVQPSVITPTGFLKECYCCRETALKDRLVKLTQCYNPDGERLYEADVESMDIRLKEPTQCQCFKCGDFSR